MSGLLDAPLLSGALPWAVTALGIVAGLFLLVRRPRRWWTLTVPAVIACAAVLTAVLALLVDTVWRPFPDPLPFAVLLALAAALAGLGLGAAGMVLAGPGRRRWWHRAGTALAIVVVLVVAAQGVNAVYQSYPTLRTALALPGVDEVPFAEIAPREQLVVPAPGRPLQAVWSPPPGMPSTGAVVQVPVPGPSSGFAARPARLYLPPAYLASPRAQLPVLVLLSGQPGTPRDWLDGGRLAQRMDAFAAAHEGLAPVVVMADDLGSTLANPLCMDSRLGNVATYLSVDVPAWVRSTLQVQPAAATWAIGGFSNGGTCALQMAVNAPAAYPTFVDISGESGPTLGDRAATVRAAFGGDEAAFAAVNPLDVLATSRYPGTAAYLVAGVQDRTYLPQAQQVYAACQAAGMDVGLHVLEGGHNFEVWGPGLEQALPWLATRMGLTS